MGVEWSTCTYAWFKMKRKAPGSIIASILSKARHPKDIICRLEYLEKKHGGIFWDYPLLKPSSRVLIVFDNKLANAIARDDILFARASEYWEKRDTSNDLYERLLGDSLYFSDGYHHQKRTKDYEKRLYTQKAAAEYINELSEVLAEYNYENGQYSFESLNRQVYSKFLKVYYNVSLTDETLELVSESIQKAWNSRNKALTCPYRLLKRESTRIDRQLIDRAKTILLSEMERSQDVPSYKSGTSSVSLTHKYLAEEGLASGLSIIFKLADVIENTRTYMESLDERNMAQLVAESAYYSAEDGIDKLENKCPQIIANTKEIISKLEPPVRLLKRVAVCDTNIEGIEIIRTTEIWIPTWTSTDLLFGAGMYACKGKVLTTLITTSLVKYLAIRKSKIS